MGTLSSEQTRMKYILSMEASITPFMVPHRDLDKICYKFLLLVHRTTAGVGQ